MMKHPHRVAACLNRAGPLTAYALAYLACVFSVYALIVLAACQSVTPRQNFVNACSTVGETMVRVIAAKRGGLMDQATFNHVDDLYDAAVTTCSTIPPTDTAAETALVSIHAFLQAAGDAGVDYGTY